MIVGPRTAYRLTGSMLAAFLPAVAWLVVSVWLTLNRNDVMLTAPVTVTSGQWRLMLLLGLGALAAAATLALLSGDRLRDKIARSARRAAWPAAFPATRGSDLGHGACLVPLRGILDVRCAALGRERGCRSGGRPLRTRQGRPIVGRTCWQGPTRSMGRTCWQGPTRSMARTCSLGPTP